MMKDFQALLNNFESRFHILGGTAIEDKLQDNVPDVL
eukprot:CAMPEP_0116995144 /NCGR_PEP_ID=MMETSP0467-20121206/68572_1 /TAXON_ID=283647 /ORGANISM="Mesodinium pulex, Strain SPMC105" /LENGTH=36 /DNA_ID= /DNA_START= /DNA_END= /DNA_ORIENTATION=